MKKILFAAVIAFSLSSCMHAPLTVRKTIDYQATPEQPECADIVKVDYLLSDETLTVTALLAGAEGGAPQPDPRFILELVQVGRENDIGTFSSCRPEERCPDSETSEATYDYDSGVICVLFSDEFYMGCFREREICL